MGDIRDKIAKLLSLADSANEHEAKAALLKARELMAQHKLRPEDIRKDEKTRVIIQTVGVTCTKMTDTWAVSLSATIAEHYCCKAFRRRYKRAKTVEVGFAGLEEDFEICKQIYLYAYDCVQSRLHEIQAESREKGISAGTIREMCNAYGYGFNYGLQRAYALQQEQHQEWGLVMAIPQQVEAATAHYGPSSLYGKANVAGWRGAYAQRGFQDGKAFDIGRRIAPAPHNMQQAISGERAPLPQYSATVELSRDLYPLAQSLLVLGDFSAMREERRRARGVQEDSETQLAEAAYPNGTSILLTLRSGQSNYYVLPMIRLPGEKTYTELPEYISYTLRRQMTLEVRGCRYTLCIELQDSMMPGDG